MRLRIIGRFMFEFTMIDISLLFMYLCPCYNYRMIAFTILGGRVLLLFFTISVYLALSMMDSGLFHCCVSVAASSAICWPAFRIVAKLMVFTILLVAIVVYGSICRSFCCQQLENGPSYTTSVYQYDKYE